MANMIIGMMIGEVIGAFAMALVYGGSNISGGDEDK